MQSKFRLPQETWRLVFQQAVQTPEIWRADWDYHVDDRLWQTWAREDADQERRGSHWEKVATRRCIVRVCREWKELGSEFLYETIDLGQYINGLHHQAAYRKLVQRFRTSEDNPSTRGYGWWTKRIDCPREIFSRHLVESLFDLLNCCHNVVVLTFHVGSAAPLATQQTRLWTVLQSRFRHSLRRVIHHFGELRLSDPHLTGYPQLVPSIPLLALEVTFRDLPPIPSAMRCSLTSLTLRVSSIATQKVSFKEWQLPRLRHLAIQDLHSHRIQCLIPFVQQHAKTLVSFCFDGGGHELDASIIRAAGPQLLNLSLGSLQLVRLPSATPLDGITHPGILDLMGLDDGNIPCRVTAALKSHVFPDLQRVRLLQHASPLFAHPRIREMVEVCGENGISLADKNGLAVKLFAPSGDALGGWIWR